MRESGRCASDLGNKRMNITPATTTLACSGDISASAFSKLEVVVLTRLAAGSPVVVACSAMLMSENEKKIKLSSFLLPRVTPSALGVSKM